MYIDATICLDYSWTVHDDTCACGSDNFPVILEYKGPTVDEKVPRGSDGKQIGKNSKYGRIILLDNEWTGICSY